MTDKVRLIEIIGAPISEGGGHAGTALGPAALRATGLEKRLNALGYEVHDKGDVSPKLSDSLKGNSSIRNFDKITGWARALSDSTYSSLVKNAFPIIIGGDHSVSIGSINGIARYHFEVGKELFVLWLDGHADFNNPEISPTGNAHGMPAAFLCGEPGMEEIFLKNERHTLSPQNLFIFGPRWIDPEEQLLLGRRGVNVFDIRMIDKIGVPTILNEILDHVKSRNGALHVSFDLDCLDPSIAPGVGTPEPCGISLREVHLIMELLYDSGLVTSIDIVELNPLLDERNKSGILLIELLSCLLGRKIMDIRKDSPMRNALMSSRYGEA